MRANEREMKLYRLEAIHRRLLGLVKAALEYHDTIVENSDAVKETRAWDRLAVEVRDYRSLIDDTFKE